MIMHGENIVINLILKIMVKVKVKQNVSNKPKFIILIISFSLVFLVVISGFDKIKNIFNDSKTNSEAIITDNPLNEKYEEVLSKGGYDKMSFEDWKVIARHDAQKYYENMQNLTYADMYATEAFITSYNNDWVTFRNSLDDYANLSSDQCELLKDFYQKTRDEMSERVKKKLEDNDKKLRPNKYE